MKEDKKTLIQEMAGHICKTHDTIRKTAKIFGYSKSTVHKYVTIKLLTLMKTLLKNIFEGEKAQKENMKMNCIKKSGKSLIFS